MAADEEGPSLKASFLNVPVRGKVAGQPGQHANLRANLQRVRPNRLSSVQLARGIKPGTPVLTTVLNRTLVVMPSRISRMASSGRVEISKFSWIRRGLVEVVRKEVPRCTAQAS